MSRAGRKAYKLKTIRAWLHKLTTSAGGQYSLRKLGTLVDRIDTMTFDELCIVNTMIVAGYESGCHDTRTHIQELRRIK